MCQYIIVLIGLETKAKPHILEIPTISICIESEKCNVDVTSI
jgi:hypothetical protein